MAALLPILLALGLGAGGLYFVLYPLLHGESVSPVLEGTATADAEARVAVSERELAARSALQEVELDYQLGNIAEDDYRSLRERYLRRALQAMKSRYAREQDLDDLIEQRVRSLREADEQSNEISELDEKES